MSDFGVMWIQWAEERERRDPQVFLFLFPLLPYNSQKDGPGGGKGGAGGGSSKDPVTVALNSDDPLYTEIRGLHLEALGQTLNEK